jgi:hypothetical protein
VSEAATPLRSGLRILTLHAHETVDTGRAMSQENVERVRRAYRLYQETQQPDYESLHRDVAWHTARDLPDSATYR